MVSTFNSIFQFWMHRINAIYSIFNLSRNCRKKFSFIVFVSIGCYMDTYLVWGQRIEGAIMLMGTWHLDQLVCPHANGEFYWQEKQYDGKHLPSEDQCSTTYTDSFRLSYVNIVGTCIQKMLALWPRPS